MARPILIGEAPPRGGPTVAGALASSRTLAAIARLGVDTDEYLRRTVRLNLLGAWPGPAGAKGALFPEAEARASATAIALRLHRRVVVLLGRRVAAAIGSAGRFTVHVLGQQPRWERCSRCGETRRLRPAPARRWPFLEWRRLHGWAFLPPHPLAPDLQRGRRVSFRAVLLPHPSGIVTWYNDPDRRRAAGDVLRRAMEGDVPCG